MTMLFRYRLLPVSRPPVALGGRWVRPKPLITTSLIGPTNTWISDGLLDTGADDTVFSEDAADVLGLDLTNARRGSGLGLGLATLSLRFAEVTIRLTDGREQREWLGWVGFTPTKLRRSILGFGGFLQFFTATFHGDREQVELTTNSFYRGK
jgi:hypothetical protein